MADVLDSADHILSLVTPRLIAAAGGYEAAEARYQGHGSRANVLALRVAAVHLFEVGTWAIRQADEFAEEQVQAGIPTKVIAMTRQARAGWASSIEKTEQLIVNIDTVLGAEPT